MKTRLAFRTCWRRGLPALLLLSCVQCNAGASAQAPSSTASRALSAADHYLEMEEEHLRVRSEWVVQRQLTEGEALALQPPLPASTALFAEHLRAVRDAQGAVVALAPTRELFPRQHVRVEVRVPSAEAAREGVLPLPSPEGDHVQRVRLHRELRFEPAGRTELRVGAGIQVAASIRPHTRRGADVALDGPRSHRRVGAYYLRGSPEGIRGELSSMDTHRGLRVASTVALFGLCAVGVAVVFRRAQSAVQAERVDAYIASALPHDEAQALGVELSDPLAAPSAQVAVDLGGKDAHTAKHDLRPPRRA